jgi:hypothetical protein
MIEHTRILGMEARTCIRLGKTRVLCPNGASVEEVEPLVFCADDDVLHSVWHTYL